MEPPGHPKRPKIGTKSPLDTLFFQNRHFSRNAVSPRRSPILRPQDGTQDDPRSPHDSPKTILKSFFFHHRFCLRFWCVLAPFWLHLGLLGAPMCSPGAGPCWLKNDPNNPRRPKTASRSPKIPSRPSKTPPRYPKMSPRRPKTTPKTPQDNPKRPKIDPRHPQNDQTSIQDPNDKRQQLNTTQNNTTQHDTTQHDTKHTTQLHSTPHRTTSHNIPHHNTTQHTTQHITAHLDSTLHCRGEQSTGPSRGGLGPVFGRPWSALASVWQPLGGLHCFAL